MWLFALACAAVLLPAGSASAAEVRYSFATSGGPDAVYYSGGAGERNSVAATHLVLIEETQSREGTNVVKILDPGALSMTGHESALGHCVWAPATVVCTSVNRNAVVPSFLSEIDLISVTLGDGDDSISYAGQPLKPVPPTTFYGTQTDGGSGNDRITGGTSDDHIDGGPGADTISCGTGADWVSGAEPTDTIAADCETVSPAP